MRRSWMVAVAGLASVAAPAHGVVGGVQDMLDTTLVGRTFEHSYEGLGCVGYLDPHAYSGFIYNGGNFYWSFLCFGPPGYPPCDGSTLAANIREGIVRVEADQLHPFNRVSGCCDTAAPFANPNGITVEVMDVRGEVAKTTCKSNYFSYARFSLTTVFPAFVLTMHDSASYWAWDDLKFSLAAT